MNTHNSSSENLDLLSGSSDTLSSSDNLAVRQKRNFADGYCVPIIAEGHLDHDVSIKSLSIRDGGDSMRAVNRKCTAWLKARGLS